MTNSSEQKSKVRKIKEAKASPTEEIVVNLASEQAEPKQGQGEPKDLSVELDQVQQKLDELTSMHQVIRSEIETLKKRQQTTEEFAAKKIDAAKREQQESERQRAYWEGKIRDLEKNMAALAEKQHVKESPAQPVGLAPSVVEMKKPAEPQTVAANALRPKPLASPEQKTVAQAAKTFHSIEAQVSTTVLTTNGSFVVQSTIGLTGKDALQFTRNQAPFQISWYAQKLTGGGSTLLKSSHANLTPNKPEYTIKADLPRLVTGPHRLMTVVIFPTAGNRTTYYQGPIIQTT